MRDSAPPAVSLATADQHPCAAVGATSEADLHRTHEGILGQFWFTDRRVLGVDSLTDYLPTGMNVDGILLMGWLVLYFRRISFVLEDGVSRLELHERRPDPPRS